MDSVSGILTIIMIATHTGGFHQLLEWPLGFGQIIAFGIESGHRSDVLSIRCHGHRLLEGVSEV